jgi:hypothetical protein
MADWIRRVARLGHIHTPKQADVVCRLRSETPRQLTLGDVADACNAIPVHTFRSFSRPDALLQSETGGSATRCVRGRTDYVCGMANVT